MNASGETLSGLELSLQALKLQVNLTTRKAKTKQIFKNESYFESRLIVFENGFRTFVSPSLNLPSLTFLIGTIEILLTTVLIQEGIIFQLKSIICR